MILLFAALVYIFHYLWENHTQIVYHEPMPPRYEAWESVEQNPLYLFIFVISLVFSEFSAICLIFDLIFCRFKTIVKGDQHLTIYRGLFHHRVYVDGVEKGFHCFPMYTNVIEVWMANRVRVTVTLSRNFWYMAHISFSDHTASVEI